MLKVPLFALAAGFAACAVAQAQTLPPLLVGSVRDREGRAVDDGVVRATDAAGKTLASGPTDRDGTFALALAPDAVAVALEVSCRYCRTERVALSRGGDIPPIFVERDAALASPVPNSNDLRALPYGRVVEVLGLIPFTLVRGNVVSDRGLAEGRSLIVDAGAPIDDAATRNDSSLEDVPNRYARDVSVIDPLQAFRYGAHAAGGAFVLDHLADASSGVADAGSSHDANALARIGSFAFASGTSGDAGNIIRRADADGDLAAFGGRLRAGYALVDSTSSLGSGAGLAARNAAIAHVAYATASRRAVTSVAASFADVGVDLTSSAPDVYRSQYANGTFRVQRPGPVSLELDASGSLQNARYSSAADRYTLAGSIADETFAVSAATSSAAGSFALGLAVASVAERGALSNATLGGTRAAILPSLDGTLAVGSDVALHAGYAGALDAPTLLDADAAVPYGGSARVTVLGRTALSEAALRFDDGARIRAEVGIFRGVEAGLTAVPAANVSVAGIGSSVVWSVARHVDLRAWSLSGSTSRALVWATYANPFGMRFDAIARDEPASASARRGVRIDASVAVPLGSGIALTAGSVARPGGRGVTVGLRYR